MLLLDGKEGMMHQTNQMTLLNHQPFESDISVLRGFVDPGEQSSFPGHES